MIYKTIQSFTLHQTECIAGGVSLGGGPHRGITNEYRKIARDALDASGIIPMNWRLMKSAPKDGSEILVVELLGDDHLVQIAYYDKGDPTFDEPGWYSNGGSVNPAFWMPLPTYNQAKKKS